MNAFVVSDAAPLIPIQVNVEYLEDPKGQWGIGDISSKALADNWKINKRSIINFGVTDSTMWYRFRVQDRTNISKGKTNWLLEIDWPPLANVDIYRTRHIDEKNTGHPDPVFLSGFLRPPGSNYLGHRNVLLQFPLDSNEVTDVILRVNTPIFQVAHSIVMPQTVFMSRPV